MNALLVGVLLAVQVASPTLPTTGVGFVDKVNGDPSLLVWGLGGLRFGGLGSGAGAPFGCSGTCEVNFSQLVKPATEISAKPFLVFATFEFFGPSVSVTAEEQCPPGCVFRYPTWKAQWPTVPITVKGWLTFVELGNSDNVTTFEIVGSGTATAFSYYEADRGPWNYATLRWDFTYSVVPEPSTLLLSASGVVLLLGARQRRRMRAPPV